MSILLGNPLLFTGAGETGYLIERSLRFNSSDSAYLSRTPASAGNRKTWTFSCWMKRSGLTGINNLLSNMNAANSSGLYSGIASDQSFFFHEYALSGGASLNTLAVFRDPSAWYHLIIAYDTTQATASNRFKLYVNGIQATLAGSYPTQNLDGFWNRAVYSTIGNQGAVNANYFDGLLADIHFCDGTAYDASAFGEFDANGIWQPKKFAGVYGSQGWHLDFSDNSTAAGLGTDTSGNGNTWTVNNFAIGGTASYARYLTQTSGDGTFSGPYAAFDGDTATACGVSGATGTGVITFTPGSAIPASSLRVYLYTGETGNGSPVSISVNGGSFTNCTTLGANNNSTEWVTATSLITGGQITSIAVQRVNMSGFGYNIHAIEVNGSQLIDASFAGNDSLVDVPTNGSEVDTGSGGQVRGNYCTLNPLNNPATSATLGNGNLEVTANTTLFQAVTGTVFASSGKWYAEFTQEVTGTDQVVGIAANTFVPNSSTNRYVGRTADSYAMYSDGRKINNNVFTSYGSSWTTGDVIGVALDLDNGKVWFSKNGTWQASGDPSAGTNAAFTGITGSYTFACSPYGSGKFVLNAGARSFAYTAPSGFKALNTANLPAPVVTKPSTVMDVKLYTGNGGTQTISGLNMSPDLVWVKSRDEANTHNLYDIVRGTGKELVSNTTAAEASYGNSLTSFDSTGFGLGSASWMNGSSKSYVAWTWDAGSSTVTNTQGSISSQVRANASAGFSVVTYTGNGSSSQTVGHGLGAKPGLIIVKSRSNGTWNWGVYHSSLTGSTPLLALNGTGAANNLYNAFNPANNTSSVFGIGNEVTTNESSGTYVAYCWAPLVGYSSMGSYVGNGSSDGPFVYTGFRPRWVLIKRSDTAGANWYLLDSARNTYNVTNSLLRPNLSDAEVSAVPIDFLSNGFKPRDTDAGSNASGGTYIYAAFAESPFQYARAR
jgi:hypothetical protein